MHFFVYTVCFALKFTWQQALSMVFICGLINIFITVTKIRKTIIKAIPQSLQMLLVVELVFSLAYLGFLNVGMINFDSGGTSFIKYESASIMGIFNWFSFSCCFTILKS